MPGAHPIYRHSGTALNPLRYVPIEHAYVIGTHNWRDAREVDRSIKWVVLGSGKITMSYIGVDKRPVDNGIQGQYTKTPEWASVRGHLQRVARENNINLDDI